MRYRRRQKQNEIKPDVTAATYAAHAITPEQMCYIAGRVSSVLATPSELEIADKLIMMRVRSLPPDSTVNVL
jgi:hypothetical protein